MRKIFTLAMLLIVSLLATPLIRAASSGTCGENLTWTLDDDGNLVIEGTGKMMNGRGPWGTEIKTAKIAEGVTSIGNMAFTGCASLTSISIPNSVTSIGRSTFYKCSSLTSISIPNSVTTIGVSAFDGCSSLKIIKLSNSLNKIERSLFNECSSLIDIAIPNSVTSIGDYAFSGCSSLTSIEIPNSVTSIGYCAFSGCSSLNSIEIPNSLMTIGDSAFEGCSSLTSISIPNSVTTVGDSAFEGCSSLTSIVIPSSVTSIGIFALAECVSMESIVVDKDNKVYDSRNNCNAIIETATNMLLCACINTIIPNSVVKIETGSYFGLDISSIQIPASVTSIGVFLSNNDNLVNITVDKGNKTYDSRDNCNAIIETSTNTLLAGCKNTRIPNSVVSIGNKAFSYCAQLENIEIPNSVVSLGEYAFSSCQRLESIEIPNSVTSIGSNSFYNCKSLKNAKLSSSMKNVSAFAFFCCRSLKKVEIPNSVESIDNTAFGSCVELTDIVIPASVTTIGESAFAYCTSLSNIRCLAVEPPKRMGGEIFSNVDKTSCILEVPEESVDKYKTTTPWSEFVNIVGIETGGIDDVDADENDVHISVDGGEIIVDGIADNEVMEVYNINGATIYRGSAKSVNVPTSGVYVVRVAGKTAKVVLVR